MKELSLGGDSRGQVPKLMELTEAIKPSPARDLVMAWLRLGQSGGMLSPGILSAAETECTSKEELSYVLHVEAIMFFHSGDLPKAVDKAAKCLELCSRIGDRKLEAQTLLHLSHIYTTLGHSQLGAEYADAATRTWEGRITFS
jgi:hypothetical protein